MVKLNLMATAAVVTQALVLGFIKPAAAQLPDTALCSKAVSLSDRSTFTGVQEEKAKTLEAIAKVNFDIDGVASLGKGCILKRDLVWHISDDKCCVAIVPVGCAGTCHCPCTGYHIHYPQFIYKQSCPRPCCSIASYQCIQVKFLCHGLKGPLTTDLGWVYLPATCRCCYQPRKLQFSTREASFEEVQAIETESETKVATAKRVVTV